jgi:hypothetical protein
VSAETPAAGEGDETFDDVDLSNAPAAPAAPATGIVAPAATPAAADAAETAAFAADVRQRLGPGPGRLSSAPSLPYRCPHTGAAVAGGQAVATSHVADVLLHYTPFFMM